MGDRGNIAVQYDGQPDQRVYLYTHWRGSDISDIVRQALAREERWDDPSYLTRIIFCELIKGYENGTTEFGIDVKMGDNDHAVIVVDTHRQTVYLDGMDPEKGTPFGEFIAMNSNPDEEE